MAQLHAMRFGNLLTGLETFIQQVLVGKKNLIGIQIGSYAGESTNMFVNTGAFKRLWCIDPWVEDYDENDATCDGTVCLAEKAFDERFKNCTVVAKLKAKSTDVVNMFEDESIDFIYIDGNHQYNAVKKDLENYYPKIKTGSFIAGHDYGGAPHTEGTKKAIREFFGTEPLKVYEDTSWIYIKGYNPIIEEIRRYVLELDKKKGII